MRGLLTRRNREPGWLAISMQPGAVHFAHAQSGAGGKASIARCGVHPLGPAAADLAAVAKELSFDRHQCTTLLSPGEYQMMLVEAPNVPPAELKTAVRWRVKDLLDYHLDDATIDVLDIPPDPSGANRAHSMYAVAARNEVIQACIGRFDAARIPLTVIDIAETAQRNVAALFEPAGQGLAFLYVGDAQALLTINFRGELYLARRIDTGIDQLQAEGAARDDALSRISLELQRSFDHFDRQFPFVRVAKLLLGPEPHDTGMALHLSRNLDIAVERAQLGEVLSFADAEPDEQAAWELFHVLGAALRNETKTL